MSSMPSAPPGDSRPESPTYYWADGRTISLRGSEEVAVELERANRSKLSAAQIDRLRNNGQQISRSLVVVDRRDLDFHTCDELEAVAALQPVYRADDGTRMI